MSLLSNCKLFFLTKKAQSIIISKVRVTNRASVSSVNKIFNIVKSEIVEKNDYFLGSYDPTLRVIDYYGNNNLNLSIALHENLHAASRYKYSAYVEPYSYLSHNIGFQKDEKHFIQNGNKVFEENLSYGEAINEAFTEYFTYLLLKENGIEKTGKSYLDRCAVISAFFYKWNKKGEIIFDKEMSDKMFALYINADVNGLVDLLTTHYFSTKAKVLKLIFEMDMMAKSEVESNNIEQREWLARCMQTVFDIHFDRYHHNHPKRTKADFVNRHNSRVIFPIGDSELIKDSIQLAKINFLSEPKIRINNEYANFEKFLLHILYDANSNNDIEKSRAPSYNHVKLVINSPMLFNSSYLQELSSFSGIEKLDFILFCANMQNFTNAKLYHKFLNRIIPIIIKNGMPKHRDARNQAMFYLLNLPGYRFAEAYKFFSPKEIVDYINNDKQHIAVNCRAINDFVALKNYLSNDIQDLVY